MYCNTSTINYNMSSEKIKILYDIGYNTTKSFIDKEKEKKDNIKKEKDKINKVILGNITDIKHKLDKIINLI